jgi:hypothetical protein
MNKAKTKQRERVNDDSFEATGSLGKGLADTFKNDVVKGFTHDLWEQLLATTGETRGGASGDLREGEEISFKREEFRREAKRNAQIEAGIDYKRDIIHAERRIRNVDSQQLSVRVEEIIIELKKLSSSSKALETEFKGIATITMPQAPGKYHQNFFEWMLTVVRSARARVESAEQWLKTISGKGKKKDYWGLYKKHGTSFGLSGERTVAQQTG